MSADYYKYSSGQVALVSIALTMIHHTLISLFQVDLALSLEESLPPIIKNCLVRYSRNIPTLRKIAQTAHRLESLFFCEAPGTMQESVEVSSLNNISSKGYPH